MTLAAVGADARWQRFLPQRAWGQAYVWGILAGLGLMGLLAVVHVASPLPEGTFRKAGFTVVLLLATWGASLFVPALARFLPTRPLGYAAAPLLPFLCVLLLLDLWSVFPAVRLGPLFGATAILLLTSALVCPAFHSLRRVPLLAAPTLLGVVLGGLVFSLAVAEYAVDDRILQGAWQAFLVLFFASLVLLAAPEGRPWSIRLGWTAFAQFAIVVLVKPWQTVELADRLTMAGFVLAVVLGLAAMTVRLIPTRALKVD